MCIIIWAPSGKIPRDHIINAMLTHQDGWGFAIPTGKKIVTYRTTDFKRFLEAWVGRIEGPVLFHARWASHGAVCNANCHPFRINGHGLVVAHNGIIPGYGSETKSDTRDFIEKVLTNLPDWFLEEEKICRAIEGAIGGSKLAFLDREGNIRILNEHLGLWSNGRWYSNRSAFGTPTYQAGE